MSRNACPERSRRVAILVRRSPFNTEQTTEALRLAVGQVLADNKVTVLFWDDGVEILRPTCPQAIGADDAEKHLSACRELGFRLVADGEALARKGIDETVVEVERADPEQILRVLKEVDVVIPF